MDTIKQMCNLATNQQRRRTIVVVLAACTAILLAGVVVAQASENYDLACRGVLNSGGGYRVTPSNNFALVDATGQSIAGISQSNNFGVYGGYVHSLRSAQSPTQNPPPNLGNNLRLPLIVKAGRVIRGGC